MTRALIVSSSERGQEALREMLSAAGYAQSSAAASGADARRLLLNQPFELVIVNAPLSDEFGHELAAHAAAQGAGAILICRAEHAEQLGAVLEREGVFVMSRPLVRQLFMQALHLVEMARSRIYELMTERDKLRRQLEDMRTISRAKCLLIEHAAMTEAQAHRYIEKQAMDMRTSRREVAECVIRTYSA